MTLSTTTNRVSYAGSGTTGPFTFSYVITANSDLVVTLIDADDVETTLTETTDYSITLDESLPSAGSITTVVAVASGETLVLRRVVALTQTVDIEDNDSLPANSLEQQSMDKFVMMAQQLQEQLNRAIVQPTTESTQLTLPAPEEDKYLTYDGSDLIWEEIITTDAIIPTYETGKFLTNDGTDLSWGSASNSYTVSFDDADLTAGVLTVTHSLATQYVTFAIYDNSDKFILPDEATATDEDTLTIDLSSFGTISGTWNIRVGA